MVVFSEGNPMHDTTAIRTVKSPVIPPPPDPWDRLDWEAGQDPDLAWLDRPGTQWLNRRDDGTVPPDFAERLAYGPYE
jgi:hypothetical protein